MDTSEFEPVVDEIEIVLRPARTVATRLIALAAVVRRLAIESAVDLAPDDDAETERLDLALWLREQDVWQELTGEERETVETITGDLNVEQRVDATWAAEALATLGWVAGLNPAPAGFERIADPSSLLDAVPAAWDDIRSFTGTLQLRDELEIAAAQEAAALWLWRLALEPERRRATSNERSALDAVVAATWREATGAGIWEGGDGDALLDGSPVGGVDEELLELATGIAHARCHTLNWVCGFGESWDDVPLDV